MPSPSALGMPTAQRIYRPGTHLDGSTESVRDLLSQFSSSPKFCHHGMYYHAISRCFLCTVLLASTHALDLWPLCRLREAAHRILCNRWVPGPEVCSPQRRGSSLWRRSQIVCAILHRKRVACPRAPRRCLFDEVRPTSLCNIRPRSGKKYLLVVDVLPGQITLPSVMLPVACNNNQVSILWQMSTTRRMGSMTRTSENNRGPG